MGDELKKKVRFSVLRPISIAVKAYFFESSIRLQQGLLGGLDSFWERQNY